MKVRGQKLIVASFVISFIGLLTATAALVVRIINKTTGIGLEYFSPLCTNSYNNTKYSYSYLSFKAQFVGNILGVVVALINSLLLFMPTLIMCKSKNQKDDQESRDGGIEVKLEILYLLTSMGLVGWIIAAGGPMNIWIEGKLCSFYVYYNMILITFIGSVAGVVFLLNWILLLFMLANSPTQNGINFQDLKIKGEEQELSKRVDDQIKGFIDNVNRNKLQMRQQLLHYQQQIYDSNKQFQPDSNFQYLDNLRKQQESQYSYYYQEVEYDHPNLLQQLVENKNPQEGIQPSPMLSPTLSPSLSFNLSRNQSKGIKKDSSKVQVQLQRVPNKNGEFDQNEVKQSQNDQEIRQPSIQLKLGQLQRNMSDSPSQLTPAKPKKVQLINQNNLRKNPDDGWTQLENFRLEAVEQPISEEISKLLKITLFNNSSFFTTNLPQLQQQCPIQKYLDRDQRFEIAQPNTTSKKNRKNEYSKQQLVFSKKRKDRLYEQQQYKKTMKQDYNQTLAVKRERPNILNLQQLQRLEVCEKEREESTPVRYKKHNIIDSIRSKYT